MDYEYMCWWALQGMINDLIDRMRGIEECEDIAPNGGLWRMYEQKIQELEDRRDMFERRHREEQPD